MDDLQQQLILMNDRGEQIGIATRDECHRKLGKMHWGYILLLRYPDGRFLLTRRSDTKSCGAGLWDGSVVSHVLQGETLFRAIERRAKEELAISISNLTDIGSFSYTAMYGEFSENEYCSVVVGTAVDTPDPDPVEISEIRFVTFDQLKSDIKAYKETFAPWLSIPVEKIIGHSGLSRI